MSLFFRRFYIRSLRRYARLKKIDRFNCLLDYIYDHGFYVLFFEGNFTFWSCNDYWDCLSFYRNQNQSTYQILLYDRLDNLSGFCKVRSFLEVDQ